MKKTLIVSAILLWVAWTGVRAQIGQYRNDLSLGVNGGYVFSTLGFTPKVNQTQHGGFAGGLSFRYVCEKYFSTVCSVYAELNYAQIGWKESILDMNDRPVVNKTTGVAEKYSRTLNYVQLPVFAHLAWGKETKGFQFFFQAGPQFGYYLGDKTEMNFELDKRNVTDRVNNVVRQDTMAVENKLDYGIAVGAGVEYSHPKLGHFLLEGRYYYGLGNIYGNSKRDYFAKSNIGNIVLKITYLFNIIKTRKD
ncbi:MAG: porin family protein [Prevotellaceae bacterium]|nr:PorT family protein [Prevotella sp.]MDD7257119.1 porin family protein [Prevotellaceae bacterium]MDY6130488.1 porin family protein [Prevotella sp.]